MLNKHNYVVWTVFVQDFILELLVAISAVFDHQLIKSHVFRISKLLLKRISLGWYSMSLQEYAHLSLQLFTACSHHLLDRSWGRMRGIVEPWIIHHPTWRTTSSHVDGFGSESMGQCINLLLREILEHFPSNHRILSGGDDRSEVHWLRGSLRRNWHSRISCSE